MADQEVELAYRTLFGLPSADADQTAADDGLRGNVAPNEGRTPAPPADKYAAVSALFRSGH